MPNAVAQTEYQNPELRKQKEETEKHSAGFGDLLKGWFKNKLVFHNFNYIYISLLFLSDLNVKIIL
ncbi:hypothetical protein ACGO3R_10415 [Lactococcus lactis]